MSLDPTPGPLSQAETSEDARWKERHAVLFKAWTQVRYQRRRQRFFELLDRSTKAITVVLGASLLGQFFAGAVPWLGVAITSLGLLSLVYGYGDRKQLHKELAEQAANLVGSIEAVPAGELTAKITAAWAAEFARLCAKAPPPLKTLTLICEREQAIAENNPNHVEEQPSFKRVLAHFLN